MAEKRNNEYGLLIDYEYCSGCHACETACKMEHDFPTGDFGIHVLIDGPRENKSATRNEDRYEYEHIPVPTALCDLCKDRLDAGKLPTCVHHCQAGVMVYGKLEELVAKINKPKMVIWSVNPF